MKILYIMYLYFGLLNDAVSNVSGVRMIISEYEGLLPALQTLW
jgi:hypothetical protein